MADKVESGDDSCAVLSEGEGETQLTLDEINERLDTLCALEKTHTDMIEKHKEQYEEIKAILDDCSRDIRMLQNKATAIEKSFILGTTPMPFTIQDNTHDTTFSIKSLKDVAAASKPRTQPSIHKINVHIHINL
ncbi:hypothetical protein DPMN_030928 [Dreissena polymorpha]|uniref:Uncharacterized protein n=1 Tax=Dreissena polymorpha TaxID=45954 RepID=A0A9D4M3K3_DREPO|nr:hypothetical protein DPMN_030928 [Dreissena polymorpha]